MFGAFFCRNSGTVKYIVLILTKLNNYSVYQFRAEELERERRQQREKGNHRSGGRNQNRGNGGGQKRRRAKSSGPGRRDRRGY